MSASITSACSSTISTSAEKKLEELGAPCFMKQDTAAKNSFFETKFRGPDGVVFDVSEHPWVGAAPAGVADVPLKEKVSEPAE